MKKFLLNYFHIKYSILYKKTHLKMLDEFLLWNNKVPGHPLDATHRGRVGFLFNYFKKIILKFTNTF